MIQQVTLLEHFLINTAKRYPDKTALICGKEQYTYKELLGCAYHLSDVLKQKGIQRGDRIVIQSGNSLLTIISFWAGLISDAVVSVIADDQPDEKVIYILKDSGAKIFIANTLSDKLVERLKSFSESLVVGLPNSHLKMPIVLENSFYLDASTRSNDDRKTAGDFKNHEADLASIIYTSGSTGEPKGVMLTHRNMITAVNSINQYLGHTESDVILSALPLSFDYGLYQMIMSFSVGATLILEKNALWPAALLRKVETEKVTVLPCVPTLFMLLVEHARRFNYDYSTLRAVTNTGAALTQKHIASVQSVFSKAEIFSMYGLTECKRCTYLPPKDINRKPDSVGIAIPNTELWVVDELDKKVGPGVIGQLVIRGATVMKGYWNKPEASAKKLKDGPIPGEKILYTGDYAMLDEDGYLYFKGRMDEIIKLKGIKISPIEIEKSIIKINGVDEAAVFGVEDYRGETLLVVCVVSHDLTYNTEQLIKDVRTTLPASHQPTEILRYSSLPKNNNGKIDKKLLRTELEKSYQNRYGEEGVVNEEVK